jgi:hypothetical protein
MKYLPNLAMAIAQPGAMIFFMRVARWDLLVSAGMSALIAMAVGFAVHFPRARASERKELT